MTWRCCCKAGALAAPVDIVEERTVGPSLGADNIRQGFAAAALGLALVAVFMVFYYRVFGLFAVAALLVNLLSGGRRCCRCCRRR